MLTTLMNQKQGLWFVNNNQLVVVMDKRGERKCSRTVMQGGGNSIAACDNSIAASVAASLQQLLPHSKLQHQVVAKPCSSCCHQQALA